jgi:hypothetical protein
MSAAAAFSPSRSGLRVPGMGTMSLPWASSQASASWVIVIPLPLASSASWPIASVLRS